ncbi:MAG: ABC transporter substrate-binding protein [Nocardioides sp.]|uniref:ABC transporter substrate-binding protein n=1 Tax=Nocardioides sp. TaxID=35761 RepID=UPI0039E26C46
MTDPQSSISLPDVDDEFARIVDELTRRGLLAGGAGGAALWAVAGCAGHDPRSATASSGATDTERTVTTTAGTFTVPRNPEHVVCIDYFTAIFLVELGLTPIGGIDYSWVNAASMYAGYVPALKKLANIGQISSTNFEKVAALDPDLILGPTPGSRYDNSKGAMSKLSSVAPVASVDFGQTGDWRGPLRQTAELVGRMAELKPLIASYRASIAAAKQTYADLLASTVVSVVDYSQSGSFALDLPASTDGVVLADLGVRFGKASAANGTSTRELSLERIGDLADSDIILFRADAKGAPTNGLDDVVGLSAWKELPAVKAGHTYPIGWADVCTYRWAEQAVTDLTSIFDDYRGDG